MTYTHIHHHTGAFGYADDVALVVTSLYCLKCMMATCTEFAKKHQITFNPTKSKLLCFNADKLTGQVFCNTAYKTESPYFK